tara:strand:- start:3638 stop:4213 length:576 start_codon:yes stop_codon:yes gene_type:complete
MSIFEFVLVMASLILAIGITVLLRHVALIITNRRTIELDFVAISWMVFLFIIATSMWWSFWDYSNVNWTYPLYMYLLMCPTLQFLAISMLVSTDTSKPGASLSATFKRVRLPFMILMAAFQVIVSWDGWVFGVEPFWNGLRAIQCTVILIFVIGALTSKQIVQKILVTAILSIEIIGTFLLRYLPGAYGAS